MFGIIIKSLKTGVITEPVRSASRRRSGFR